MPSDQKIDYIELPAEDLDATEAFYSSAFGWSFTDYGPDYRAFSDERLNGGFYKSGLKSRTENGATLVVLYAIKLDGSEDSWTKIAYNSSVGYTSDSDDKGCREMTSVQISPERALSVFGKDGCQGQFGPDGN